MTEQTKIIDVDASWDGNGSLDDHRQEVFGKIEQPGFGAAAMKAKTEPVNDDTDKEPDGGE